MTKILNELNRRDALKTIAAGSLLVGGAVTPAKAVPKRGGKITVVAASGSTSDNFDTRLHTGFAQAAYSRLVLNNLTKEDPQTSRIEPELATSWENSDENRTWIFNLRRGVKFHDGSDFGADDVIYSVGRHVGSDAKGGAVGFLTDMKEMKKLNNHQVKFTFKTSTPDLPAIFSLYQVMITKAGHSDWSTYNGTGAYELVEFKPGILARAKRRKDGYWDDNSAFADEIVVKFVDDAMAAVNLMRTGEADVYAYAPANIYQMLKRDSKLEAISYVSKYHFTYPARVMHEPFGDTNVIKALKYALDRDKLNQIALSGLGKVANDQPIPESDEMYNPNIPQINYDIDKAKHYLRKSGRSSLDLQLHTSNAANGAPVEEASVVYAESAKKVGINISVVREPGDGYWSDVWRKRPWVTCYWTGRATALMSIEMTYKGSSPWNDTKYQSDEMDRLITESKAEVDVEKRKQMIWRMQEIIADEFNTVIPAFLPKFEIVNKRIGGAVPSNGFSYNNCYLSSYWIK